MSVQTHETPTALKPSTGQDSQVTIDEFDLDVTFLEAGSTVKDLIYMTNDGCGQTCQSACSSTCG